jgi:response regulator RpfG family c-di-GMP phosphodiesterase
LAEKKIQCARVFPIVYEGKALGAVVGFYKQARLFTRNERRVLALYVNSISLTLRNAMMYDQIEQGYLNMALEVARRVDEREASRSESSSTLARLAEEIARLLRIPEEEVNSIHWAALLHDIGKKDIPDEVLKKSGPLSDDEWRMLRLSPQKGEKMLEPIPRLRRVAKIIRAAREHYDGSGYPDKLKGNQIPLSAKVLAVSDAYTSMIDKRPYRASLTPQEAIRQIQASSGKYFDPIVVNAFNNVASKYVN